MLEIRLLGELSVVRDGAAVALPASRKARALVAYLAASRGPHLRERLCDLLWEGPDDPRAALRWTLTKLRPVLDPHLLAGRTHVELKTDGARVDLDGLVPPQRAETAALEDCAALFRGQFIEGLDLPACFRFQQWCVGERERLRGAHVAVLAELIRRLGPNDRTVAHARRWVAVDPFSDEAHAALIALLAGRGQTPEALRQYERCRELLERELGARPGPSVEAARRSVGRAALAADVKAPDTAETLVPLVGRAVELKAMAEAQGVVLLSGEPGIGKSRLLDEARARASGPTLHARAYAAERVRPYGVWIDALRARGRAFPNEADRERLFEAVADLLADAALVVLDDVQWLDEGSAALLHFLARGGVSGPRFLCAARVGEIDDNPHVSRVVRELLRERRLARLDVGPLEPAETLALVRAVDPQADAAQVLAGSGGNPLFALELARSRPEEGSAPRSLSSLIASRLDALDGDARNLVAWASAAGRQFDVDVLGRASLIPAGVLLPTLDKLERCAILRACGERQYEFTHDLLRDVAYQALSGPRRALAHRQIAAALEAQPDPEGALSGEILNHATLAGDLERAAEAAVLTGERCLRLFAYAEAVSVGRRGLQMAETLGEAARARVEIRLMRVIVMARTPLKERLALTAGLAEAVERARRQGLMDVAAQGAAGLAILNEEMNDYSLAAAATLRSAEMARGSDRATASFALATTARCLLLLQREVPRAESLLAEAQALVPESSELSLGFGYLHAHHGRASEAEPHLERALVLAGRDQDHWREWLALARLASLALEEGRPEAALAHCHRLRTVTERMKGGSEGVKTEMLETLAAYATGRPADVEGMLRGLRDADSHADLAWAQVLLAEEEVRRGRPEPARAYAQAALTSAEIVGRPSEAVIAHGILAAVDGPGKRGRSRSPAPASDLTARARRYLEEKRHGHSRSGADV